MSVEGYAISVYGYSDDVGTAEYNLKLSERRAQAVRDYLVQSGIDPKMITTKGYGKSDPRVPGDSAAEHATNRRVEIGIVDATLRLESPAN
jgi:chemotaxis protein MotB